MTFLVSGYALISPITSSIVTPSLRNIGREWKITEAIELQMMMSVFILGYAVGPILFSPLSETFGRQWVLQLANIVFLIFNIACGFAQNETQLITLRFFAGVGGSAPLGIGGGVLSDIWTREERARSVSIYALGPVLGPAIGPVVGGFIAEYSTWRWGFWATSIVDALLLGISFFFYKETFSPVLLERQAAQLRKTTGNPEWHSDAAFRRGEVFQRGSLRQMGGTLSAALTRPVKLLAFRPTIQVMSLFMAYTYGLIYLVLSSFSFMWLDSYHESLDIVGLNYIALATGMVLGTQFCSFVQPRVRLQSPHANILSNMSTDL